MEDLLAQSVHPVDFTGEEMALVTMDDADHGGFPSGVGEGNLWPSRRVVTCTKGQEARSPRQ
jgi:hypothetical protein